MVEARVPYVTDGDGMHTFTDPADGETYVSAYVGMDIAQRVFPCFDQNDLKAPVTLRVTAPEGWTVLGQRPRGGPSEGGTWAFATTPPIPLADVHRLRRAVALGDLGARRPDGRLPFGWHARASLAAQLDRDADELRADHRGLLRPLRSDLRRAVRLRLLRPGVRARARTGAPSRTPAA